MAQRIEFIVGTFPAASETFITGQVAGLLDRGLSVHLYSFRRGDATHAAAAYAERDMAACTTYLDFPASWRRRAVAAVRAVVSLLRHNPRALLRVLNVVRYRADAWSLKLLCWAGPLAALDADVVHCHFGTVADQYRVLRGILGDARPWVTTFYGYDVSQVPNLKGRDVYRDLARECPRFIVMSQDMRRRVVALGFDAAKISVIPVGIDVAAYPFRERRDHADPVRLVTVARLVEKKGVDDLIRALSVARNEAGRALACTIVGDGPLRSELEALARDRGAHDIIRWTGFMRQEDMIRELDAADVYVQPSKTAASGDME